MAVINLPLATRLQLRLKTGVTAEGKDIFRLRTFSNIKPTATDVDVKSVADGLASLQMHVVDTVRRIDQADLVSA